MKMSDSGPNSSVASGILLSFLSTDNNLIMPLTDFQTVTVRDVKTFLHNACKGSSPGQYRLLFETRELKVSE
jgi:hypothetical protein